MGVQSAYAAIGESYLQRALAVAMRRAQQPGRFRDVWARSAQILTDRTVSGPPSDDAEAVARELTGAMLEVLREP